MAKLIDIRLAESLESFHTEYRVPFPSQMGPSKDEMRMNLSTCLVDLLLLAELVIACTLKQQGGG